MTPLDVSIATIAPDQLEAHVADIKRFICETNEPNAIGADDRMCLSWALAFCYEPNGEERVASLLKRGADPNLPTAWSNFVTFMTAASRTEPLQLMIEAGLDLNAVYELDDELMLTQPAGSYTLLDYALNVEAYLNRRDKRWVKKIDKHTGPPTGRRLFVAEVIAMLKEHGATSAAV